MDKKTYYVSVQARTIMENQGDAAYEFVIEATPEEIEYLSELFEKETGSDDDTFIRAHEPGIPYHHDESNDLSDYYLRAIYRSLYDMGTQETKSFITSMNLK